MLGFKPKQNSANSIKPASVDNPSISVPVEESLDKDIVPHSSSSDKPNGLAAVLDSSYTEGLKHWRYPFLGLIGVIGLLIIAAAWPWGGSSPDTVNPSKLNTELNKAVSDNATPEELQINLNTLVKNSRDSSNLFLIQNASGNNLFRVDGINRQIEVNGNLAVNGEVVSSGVIVAGSSSLNTQELRINNVLVCDVTGCVPSPAAIGSLDFNSLNASNITSGTLSDSRLSGFVTVQGNQFNGPNQLIKLDASGQLPPELMDGSFAGLNANQTFTGENTFSNPNNSFTGNGSGLTNVNAVTLNGQLAGFYTNADNLSSGTLADARLSANVTTRGNTFNGSNQLVLLDGSGNLPALNASSLTNINATNISSGTINDSRLSANVTVQGNTFNGASQLVQLNGSSQLPAVSGVNLTNLNASNLASGTIADARLSTSVTLQGNTFNGVNQLVRLDASGNLPALNASALTSLNATNISSGTLNDGRLSANVSLLGSSIDSTEITNDSITDTDINASAAIGWSKISKTGSSLADLATRSATDISSGTLADIRLSSNVPLKNASNTFTASNLFQNTVNSTTAFQVQNAVSGSLLNIDSLYSNITLLGNNDGQTGQWTNQPTNKLPAIRTYATTVTANGYVYVIGGWSGSAAQDTIFYAKLNADGSTGPWTNQTNNKLPALRMEATSIVANGYVYVIGGDNNGPAQDTIFYAKLNADGSTGPWTNQTNNLLPSARRNATSVVNNGYVYVFGGQDSSSVQQDTVFYAKLNADGSTGTWTNQGSNKLPAITTTAISVVANGYAYVIGGVHASTANTVYYAKLNADGSTGTWTSQASNLLPGNISAASGGMINGFIYILGGHNGTTNTNIVYYAKLNADGSTTSWTDQAINRLPGNRGRATALTANGYIYILGGRDEVGTGHDTVFYASASRIKIGGSLDLVGLGGQNLAEGGTGGTLTAGNTRIVGTLEVQDTANFTLGISVGGNLSVQGDLALDGSLSRNILPSNGTYASTTAAIGTTIDSTGDVGRYSEIAIGRDGLPVIAYRDLTGANLKIMHCGNPDCSSGNSTVTVAGQAFEIDVAIGGDGLPIISYYDSSSDFNVLKCGNISCSAGNNNTLIEALTNVGDSAIAIGTDGLPIIAYNTDGGDDLKVLKCGNSACSSGNTVTALDTTGSVGLSVSIAMAPDGLAVISYRDVTNSTLKVVKCGNTACSSGNTITTVGGPSPTTTSIGIGSDGLPIIAAARSGNIEMIKCNNATCSSATVPGAIESGNDVSMTIGRDGMPIVGYRNGGLKALKCTTVACSSGWTISVVESGAEWGNYTSVALLPNGLPIISHFSSSAADLRVNKCGNPSCSGSGTTYGGGIVIGSQSTSFQSAFVNNIQAGSSADLFSISTAGIDRLTISSSGAGTMLGTFTVKPPADSASAFQVQNSSSGSLFAVDTTGRSASGGNLIKIGDSTGTDTNTTILVLDHSTANPSSNLSALSGGLFYNSINSKVSIIENGVVKELCNKTDMSCGGNSTTLQQAYTASSGGTTPEIKADSTRGGLDIQDADSTITASLFAVRASNGSGLGTAMLDVQSTGLISIQPAVALTGTGTQSQLSQTLTNNQTAGTANGYSQAITVSNASGTTTTNGVNITVADNATALNNTNVGIKVALSGTNSSQYQQGIDVSTARGLSLQGVSTGAGPVVAGSYCGGELTSQNHSVGVCGASTSTSGLAHGVAGFVTGTGASTSSSFSGSGVFGANTAAGSGSNFYRGVAGRGFQTAAAGYTSIGVFGDARGGSGATTYGGYFTLNSASGATAGASLYASNSSIGANIFQLQDNTTDVFRVADGGFVTLQPAANMTAGQTHVTQTLTNASSTGGTVNGYSQTITVSNAGSATTTNGVNISLTDSTSPALANINNGINISLSGTNASQIQYGVNSSVNRGFGLKASSSGAGASTQCGGTTLVSALGVCGSATSSGIGVLGSSDNVTANLSQGAVMGRNTASGAAGLNYYVGVHGQTNQSTAAGYNSIGVYGGAFAGTGATTYGGYFDLIGGSSATSGAALYASNKTITANILQLQDNTTDVMTIGDGGIVTFKNAGSDSTTAFQIQDASSNSILVVDATNSHLKIYANTTSPTKYIDIYYDDSTNTGYFGVSTGTAVLGTGTGSVSMTAGAGAGFTITGNAASTITTAAGGLTISGGTTLQGATTVQGGVDIQPTSDPGTDIFSVSNSTYVRAIVNFKDNTTSVLSIADGGAALFKNSTDSTAAFQIQQAGAGATLFSADTSGLVIKVAGNTTTFGTLHLENARFKSTQTTAPTIGTPTSCATTPSAAVTANSTDSAGSFTITSGTGGQTSTCQVVITFNKAYGTAPKSIILTPGANVNSGTTTRTAAVTAITTTTFTVVMSGAATTASTGYTWYYWIIE